MKNCSKQNLCSEHEYLLENYKHTGAGIQRIQRHYRKQMRLYLRPTIEVCWIENTTRHCSFPWMVPVGFDPTDISACMLITSKNALQN